MAEEEKPKILVDAVTVVEAITTEKWKFEQTKRFNKQGIYRLNEAEMKQKFPETEEFSFADGELTTVLHHIEIKNKEKLIIKDSHSEILPDIYISGCALGDVELINCKRGRNEPSFLGNTNFYITNSSVGNFSIEQSTTGDFSISEQSTTGDFSISEQSTTGDFSISEQSTTGNFRIKQSTTGGFSISEQIITGDFWISGQSTTGNFWISEQSTTGNFWISEQSTTGNFWIEQSTTRDFSISEQSTTGYFSILGQSTTGYFWISDKCTTGYFRISGQSTTGNFTIENSYTGNFFMENSSSPFWEVKNCFASFTFSKAIIGQCKLTNCQIPQLHIQNQCEIELYVSGGQINHLNFEQLTLGKNSIVSLSSIQLSLCNMFEFTVLGNLYFRDINPAKNTIYFFKQYENRPLYVLRTDREYNRKPNENNIHWENYYNKLTDYKSHIKKLKTKLATDNPSPTFRIVKSSLGKTEFTECDFEHFRVEYKHTKLTEIFISGGTVPDDEQKVVVYECEENSLTEHEQKAAFFNQLKKVFSQMGNVYRETQYNSLSAKHQLQILRINRRLAKGTKQNGKVNRLINTIKPLYTWLKARLPGSNTFDILTFYLNRFSNNHGASWGRAAAFTLITTVIFYLLYLYSLGILGFGNGYTFDGELIGYYFSFIDITHKPDFMSEYNDTTITSGSRIISFFSRILVGFCIYQFIAAFRRHGKQG